jgi:hypothetical protein
MFPCIQSKGKSMAGVGRCFWRFGTGLFRGRFVAFEVYGLLRQRSLEIISKCTVDRKNFDESSTNRLNQSISDRRSETNSNSF